MDKECSIFFYEGYVGIAPTIINVSKLLEKQGYFVTIYGTKNNYPEPGELGKKIRIIYFLKGTKLYKILKDKGLENIVPLLEINLYILLCFFRLLQNKKQRNINIGVDIYGAIAALTFFYLFRQKFLFLSLELHEPEKFQGISAIIGLLAKLACRKSEGVIIQDEDRFKTFGKYYQYQHPRVFYLPNSTLALDNQDLNLSHENYFREKFALSQEQFPHIILQAGMISDAVFSKSLAQAFTAIDNGCALIFHDRQPRKEDPYIQSLRQINHKNLFLSLDPLPYDQIDRIYTSPTIGVAFYADLGNNFAQIAMASGKLPQYLKHGKPVLVSNLPSLSKLVEQYEFGVVIKDPTDNQEIALAIEQILCRYSTYSNNAKFCFESEFDGAKNMAPILSFMEHL